MTAEESTRIESRVDSKQYESSNTEENPPEPRQTIMIDTRSDSFKAAEQSSVSKQEKPSQLSEVPEEEVS